MTYYLPFKGIWKYVTIGLGVIFCFLLLSTIWKIIKEKDERDEVRQAKIYGILMKKRDLQRGLFQLTLRQDRVTKEVSMAGYDFFFDKLEIGDSLSKHTDTYFFDVYRQKDTGYTLVTTIGYD